MLTTGMGYWRVAYAIDSPFTYTTLVATKLAPPTRLLRAVRHAERIVSTASFLCMVCGAEPLHNQRNFGS